ncbi:MAG: chromosome partitioning protein ParB [Hyphomicrobium sp.]|uniref:ParB-like protein n=1 Tax=Hyphomicrobium sp. CS1BSMeth3 TaxID=1892844 RepID=UPI00093115C8|nr:ParB-like protein [Hyphomicrobium sp. CS1BSMeth3]MBN9262359.1 chromosome partitioning protein ParB [Hyphomicrobium sp.]MBN9267636.1 chromosome partitioning protein ParB [Hyphomicrobium sp.]
MSVAPAPLLMPIQVTDLRPTQITVGMREVERKRAEWRQEDIQREASFLGRHMLPVVTGPSGRPYLIDNHHLALALHLEGVPHVLTRMVADLHHLEKDAFWAAMDNLGWLHPFDADGRRRTYKHIPKSLEGLADDPFRSLAGELRRTGGFAKVETPFVEFLWADFLRRHIDAALLDKDMEKALTQAQMVARTLAARYLPGWCGSYDA